MKKSFLLSLLFLTACASQPKTTTSERQPANNYDLNGSWYSQCQISSEPRRPGSIRIFLHIQDSKARLTYLNYEGVDCVPNRFTRAVVQVSEFQLSGEIMNRRVDAVYGLVSARTSTNDRRQAIPCDPIHFEIQTIGLSAEGRKCIRYEPSRELQNWSHQLKLVDPQNIQLGDTQGPTHFTRAATGGTAP